MNSDLTIYLLQGLKEALPVWADTTFYVVSAVILVGTVIAARWRFKVFRLGEPHVKLDLDVRSHQASTTYKALSAVVVVTNTSRVVRACDELNWVVRVLAPYTDQAVA